VQSLTRTQQEIVDLQDELVLTQRYSGMAAERIRIARDIHDTVAQSLPSIRLLAHAAASTGEPDGMHRALGQVETLAAEGITDIRRILAALTPAELDQGALGSALARMLQRLHDETGVVTKLQVDDTLPGLSSQTEVALLRTAQSALANVRRHAQASRVTVSLIDDGDAVRLDIIDDGRGFDVSAQRHDGGDGNSYGLGFIAGRLRELGGGLDVASRPGAGTELSAHLPIHHPAKEI
jgi:signal transduction histidine kinase